MCPDDCSRKWTGCSCHAHGLACTSDSCICIQMNRECGAQCVTCGAVDRIRPENRFDDDLFLTGCQNVALQRGVSKSVVMGESTLDGVGFGLFVAEPVKRGEFLAEYAGEVISGQEAERRGMVYDRKYLSFLFDLNNEWCIDAARLGNKTRFINHAELPADGLNLEARILLVNGEHRIKFIALRDIKAGEELFFNYGKKFAEKHGLTKKLPKTNREGKKKGVVEGEEALEALDGLDPKKRRRRGEGKGAKARKARKTAAVKEVADVRKVVIEEEEVEGDEDEEMEDVPAEEEAVRVRESKRQRRMPAKYQR